MTVRRCFLPLSRYIFVAMGKTKLKFDCVDAGAMLPTQSKAVDSAWFPLVMTDAAIFHALLCTSALFGLHDMIMQRKHMLESIRLINNRLPGDGAISDATITAILFMAKAEVSHPSKESVKPLRLILGFTVFPRKPWRLECAYEWRKENRRTQRWHWDAVTTNASKNL
jgi:hypothetical protein